ncbi:MAG: DoxX family protein [Deltaproteobacteria bacterium]|nr:DoxX family protein [Deltaproteobacteria bacterium]
MNRKNAYWATTGLFCAVLGFSGFAHVAHIDSMVEAMTRLGYPGYFMTIIGLAKLCGVVALLVPERPLLKEWAYAGFVFNLLGATASHAFSGDHFTETVRPAAILLIGLASYLLRPVERRLPSAATLGNPAASGSASVPTHS